MKKDNKNSNIQSQVPEFQGMYLSEVYRFDPLTAQELFRLNVLGKLNKKNRV